MNYGQSNATFTAAGEQQGIARLVDAFYDAMASNHAYKRLQDMHKGNTLISREKLTTFLCGWMGGPREYANKYGEINIPTAHQHLKITALERDMWIECMTEALDKQPYPETLKTYLIEQLSIPAERIRQACEHYSKQ